MGERIIDFQCYNATEESCIEYICCLERLENLGLEKEDMDKMILDCSACCLRGKCTVKTGNMFLGAKTC